MSSLDSAKAFASAHHIGGTDFDKYLSLSSVMLGLANRLRNNSEVPSIYYFNLAIWHAINQIYAGKSWQ